MKGIMMDSGQYHTEEKLICSMCNTDQSKQYHYSQFHKQIFCKKCMHFEVGFPNYVVIDKEAHQFEAPVVVRVKKLE